MSWSLSTRREFELEVNIHTHTSYGEELPRTHQDTKVDASSLVSWCLCGKRIHALFTAFFLCLASLAFSQSPYLGGVGDGYASKSGTISAIRSSIAPDWARVYPSPVRRGDVMTIIAFDIQDKFAVQLFDIQGKLLLQDAQEHVIGKGKMELPTATLALGSYLLRVSRDDESFTQKIIVWED